MDFHGASLKSRVKKSSGQISRSLSSLIMMTLGCRKEGYPANYLVKALLNIIKRLAESFETLNINLLSYLDTINSYCIFFFFILKERMYLF